MKHLEIVLTKMFEIVGHNYTKTFTKNPKWYSKYSWNEEGQETFIKWMINYLMANAEARRELMAFPLKNRKMIERTVRCFVFQYGWKIR